MRTDLYATGAGGSQPNGVDDAIAAATAEAARTATQPLDPTARALEGFRIAASTGGGAGPEADASANARAAMSRTDLSPERQAQVRKVVERLCNAVIDGQIEPSINARFRQHLYDLATQPDVTVGNADGAFRGALAQMQRAVEVLDQAQLARGTQMVYDTTGGQDTRRAGLPILDVPELDADLYFKTRDGTLRVESTKYGANTLASSVDGSLAKKPAADGARPMKPDSQLGRQVEWQGKGTPDQPRATGFFMLDKTGDFTALLESKNLAALEQAVGDPAARRVVIGDRAYSVNDLRQMSQDAEARARSGDFDRFKLAWEKEHPGETFKPRTYYREALGSTPEARMQALGKTYGEPAPALKTLPQPELPSMRQGAAFGAAAAGAVTLVKLAADGQLTLDKAGEVAKHTAQGAALGAVAAKGEQLAIPVADKLIGSTVQRVATEQAARRVATDTVMTVGQKTAAAASTGFAARQVASRLAGSTAVGVVISAGMSAYENREGLAKGESRSIGNVTADTAVGAVSVAAGTAASIGAAAATGALIGSAVPVAGTVVGAVVGVAVGVGIAYGAQVSGARDAVANTVSGWADKVKGWF